eukprot:scaffold204848_cov19-Tisochrysis_lutea.AAC.1
MGSLDPSLPAAAAGAGIVVDAGFSFTHVVPFFEGQPILQVGEEQRKGAPQEGRRECARKVGSLTGEWSL